MTDRKLNVKALAVIDTNVIVSSILSKTPDTPPRQVMNLVEDGNVIPLFDERILKEYYRVLHYEHLHFPSKDVYDRMFVIVDNGICLNDVEKTTQQFKEDPSDIPFFEVKETLNDEGSYLITGNLKHYPPDPYIVNPATMLSTLYYFECYIKNPVDYDKCIDDIKQKIISEGNRTSGKALVDKIFNTYDKTINKSYFER